MKRFSIFILLLIIPFLSAAQIINPIKWKSSVEQKSDSKATLIIQPVMEKGWHIFSQVINGEGPIPTEIVFTPSPDYVLDGKIKETATISEDDPTWGFVVTYLTNDSYFSQKIKIKNNTSFKINASINYQICNDQMCLPPDDAELEFIINPTNNTTNGVIPAEQPDLTEVATPQEDTLIISNEDSVELAATPIDYTELEDGCGETQGAVKDYTSLWAIFIGGILGGLLALLTPCVFPMIPLTVSFFTKRSGNRKKGIRNALIYAFFIMFIYVGLGLLVTITLGSDALNELASNAFFNLSFFFIFLIFAISFFGAFEIVLPSSWVNKADRASDKGGLVGIFFMAFTLTLVSFSCTGPIIGTLLVEAAQGRSYLGPLIGMSGFALSLALPFALFAAFPGWMNSLPKSGGWLNTVKISLGFLELALAFKFLSNVDLTYHWGILYREIFIAIWIVIFGLLGVYLLGWLKLAHDSESQGIGTSRLLIGILTLVFTVYLIPGLWGAPLKLISGFPPPEFYKEWNTGLTNANCPHNLNCFHDYDEGMRYAKIQGKPVLIDFTGWSCVNCRKMEDNVWSDNQILKKLREDYVLISLHVDDREPLPTDEQYVSKITGKKIKTLGNKWSEMQASLYKTNSQPYYVPLDNNGKLLARPRGYTPEINIYNQFLEEGLCRYKKRK
ncbi:MAG: thioredoxin family protein [Bacteroidia bacterium]|nr:thioredoxin family protein [Bacteroidia bacterium]